MLISSRSAGKIRKTLSGGSVSGYLIDKLSCPCVVLPLKCLGFSDDDIQRSMTVFLEEVQEEEGDTEKGSDSKTVEYLKAQLKEKDEIIMALQEELAALKHD